MVREPVGSVAVALVDEMSFAAVKPFIAPLFHSWCVPFQEWFRSDVSHRLVFRNGTMVPPETSGLGLPVVGSALYAGWPSLLSCPKYVSAERFSCISTTTWLIF